MANNLQTNSLPLLKGILNNETMRANFERVLHDNAESFMSSIITLYQSDALLQKCDPNKIVTEAYKAAALDLPISKNFGYCYIIPYGTTPTFQIGYLGWIQLAQRSGKYSRINVDCVFEGMKIEHNYLTGDIDITGEPISDNVVGYFAYFRLKNGFEKAIYWKKDRVIAHAKKFSQAYKAGKKDSPWFTDFDAMAEKTVLLRLLKRFGPMSTAMQKAYEQETDNRIEAQVAEQANRQPIILTHDEGPESPVQEPQPQDEEDEGPGF